MEASGSLIGGSGDLAFNRGATTSGAREVDSPAEPARMAAGFTCVAAIRSTGEYSNAPFRTSAALAIGGAAADDRRLRPSARRPPPPIAPDRRPGRRPAYMHGDVVGGRSDRARTKLARRAQAARRRRGRATTSTGRKPSFAARPRAPASTSSARATMLMLRLPASGHLRRRPLRHQPAVRVDAQRDRR